MLNRLIFIVSILGFFVTAYLAYQYSLPTPVECPLLGGGCETVRTSEYSQFLGIYIPLYGLVFYIAVALLSVLLIEKKEINRLSLLRLKIAAAGFLFSIYLTGIEAFVIKSYCFWCLISAVLSLTIFLMVVLLEFRKKYVR